MHHASHDVIVPHTGLARTSLTQAGFLMIVLSQREKYNLRDFGGGGAVYCVTSPLFVYFFAKRFF